MNTTCHRHARPLSSTFRRIRPPARRLRAATQWFPREAVHRPLARAAAHRRRSRRRRAGRGDGELVGAVAKHDAAFARQDGSGSPPAGPTTVPDTAPQRSQAELREDRRHDAHVRAAVDRADPHRRWGRADRRADPAGSGRRALRRNPTASRSSRVRADSKACVGGFAFDRVFRTRRATRTPLRAVAATYRIVVSTCA